jgi:hypothetical protein
MDMEVLEPINEMRIQCVADGHTLRSLDGVMASLRKQGTMVAGAKRGEWAKGLDVKDCTTQKSKVVYHAGCRTSYDREMWYIAQDTIKLLQRAGTDIGIAGEKEICCGSRAYQMGYKEDFMKQARLNMELLAKTDAETLVTGCADCYYGFKVLYDKFGMKGRLEVLHITEYLARLIKGGRLKPARKVAMKVTYHDPCHLSRLGEPYIHWQGKRIPGQIRIFEPAREFRRGTNGVYQPPREVLGSLPGTKLVEMDRIKEYAWCCGAGGFIWRFIRVTGSIRETCRATGCFGGEVGGTDVFGLMRTFISRASKLKQSLIDKGLLHADGTDPFVQSIEHGHQGHGEMLIRYDPNNPESAMAAREVFMAANRTAVEGKFGVPAHVWSDEIHDIYGPHASNYTRWLRKIKKTFDPNAASESSHYISAKE